jgi:exonuclease I
MTYPLDAYDVEEIAEQDNRDDARARRIREGTETSFVVIDFETGGTCAPHEDIDSMLRAYGHEDKLLTYYDPPLWVAAIAYDREFRELETLDIKISADVGLCNPESLGICGYDQKTWENEATKPTAAAYALKEFFQRHAIKMQHDKGPFRAARLMGYNVAFDISYMRKLYDWEWCNAAFWAGRHTGYIDIMPWCQLYGIMIGSPFKSLKLEDVYKTLFTEEFPAHNPLEDCRATARIAKNIMFSMRQAWDFSRDAFNGSGKFMGGRRK